MVGEIFTYCFQPIQRLQPKFMIDSIRKLYIKHSGENPKLRIFSLIPERKRIQSNFIPYRIRTFTHTKPQTQHRITETAKSNIQTQLEQPKQRDQSGFH